MTLQSNITLIIMMVVSYLFGAIPISWLLVKTITGKNIAKEGSGNVGTMNAYNLSQKKWIGIIVLLFDMCKAIVAVILATWLFGNSFQIIFFSSISVLLGHKFNVFLKFRGGIGLAPALGIMLLINFMPAISWCLVWLVAWIIDKDMDKAIISASALGLLFPWIIEFESYKVTSSIFFMDFSDLQLFILIINLLLLISPGLYRKKV